MSRPHRFGDHDPRFPGVSFVVPSPEAWPELTAHVLGGRLPETLLSPDDGTFLDAAGRVTLLAHQTRHFHDDLVSPGASLAMRSRLLLSLTLSHVLVLLQGLPDLPLADVLPVPLTRWAEMGPPERDRFVAYLASFAPGLRPLRLPHRGPTGDPGRGVAGEALHALLDACRTHQEHVQRLRAAPAPLAGARISTAHLNEASALFVQIQDLANRTDLHTAQRFLRLVTASDASHAWTFAAVAGLFDGVGLHLDLMAEVVSWCLMARSTALAGTEGAAVARFVLLSAAVDDEPRLLHRLTGDPDDDFSVLDRATRQPGTVEELLTSVDQDWQFLTRLHEHWEGLREADALTGAHLDCYAQYLTAREHMVAEVCTGTSRYVGPDAYLRAAGTWTAPLAKVSCPPGAAATAPGGSDWCTRWQVDDGHGLASVLQPTAPGVGPAHFDADAAFEWFAAACAADVLVDPRPPDRPAADDALAHLLLAGGLRCVHLPDEI